MGQRSFVNSREINSPFGKESIFHNYYDDPIGFTFYEGETPEEDQYTYTIIALESGLEVFEKYKSDQYQPKSKEIYIFVEKQNSGKNNLFGTACRVKMGDERRELMWKLYDKKTQISVNDDTNLAGSIEQWAEDISYFKRETDEAIDKDVLAHAVKLELSNKTDANKIFQTLFGLNDKLADWIRSGVEAMDGWKLTEENYDFEKYGEKLKPIIPVNFFSQAPDYLYTGNQNKKIIKDSGLNALTQLSDNLDQIIFTKAYVLVKITPGFHDNVAYGVVWFIKEFLEESLPENLKTLLKKIKTIFAQAKQFIQKIGKELQKMAAVYNAFLCGLVNGLISLLQMVVWLVAFVIDNIPFLELENLSKEKLTEYEEKLEFVEDLIDLIRENISGVFEGLLASLDTLGEDIQAFALVVGRKIKNLSRYWWAFIIGAVAFELIIDAVFAFFTGGTSLIASISRVSTQLAKKGIKVAETTVKNIASSASSLYTSVKAFFREIIEAIKSGKFIDYLKKKFFEITGDVQGLRKMALSKWLKKFDKSFFAHIDGEAGIREYRSHNVNLTFEYLEGQGGHNANVLSKSIRRRPYTKFDPDPPIDDLPFKAEIDVLYRGYWLPKNQTSSIFPKNWKLDRIQEEIAYVYENTVAKGVGLNPDSAGKRFKQYKFKDSSNKFDIIIEIDDSGNIMNSYPK
ncbi:hypothetical protein [Moheibacter sediminis]|uniref:EndoU nuclease n=1 Tax=Moheibacter sediminis TaxID=1434700 RepID=A0A1W1ZEN6_9FLAO|nr:hypothetical protein [Moheibacter sediminis]SMC46909.1 hypothetical protein SAMN06296427_102436 [Moheibacter sediminis]